MDSPSPTGQTCRDWLTLAMVAGVGPQLRRRLLDAFGSPAAILDAPVAALLEIPGVGQQLGRQLRQARDAVDVEQQWRQCASDGIRILTPPEFPPLLQTIADPPGVLFVRGTLVELDQLAVAIVGSRHATSYGLRQAARMASAVARAGMTVVSGFARGIDIAAHRSAWESGGRTLAVLASGVSAIYPPEHTAWVPQVVDQGALISESPTTARPVAGAFPRRNRLISGLSLGVIVVEAARRSGALITARHAAEQGREVFAVPGSIESRLSRGCHQLLRDGARLVETIDDVLDELGPLVQATVDREGYSVRLPAELKLTDQQRMVLSAIPDAPTTVDALIVQCGLPAPRVLATLSVLETRGLVHRLSGQRLMRRPRA